MRLYSVPEAAANLSRLIDEALAHEVVVIARDDVPAVRLVPITPRGQRQFGALKGRIALAGSFDEPLNDEEVGGWSLS